MAAPSSPQPGATLTGAQALVRSLEEVGATSSSASPAARSCPRTTRCYDSTRVRHILVRHEQGAGHAAEGYAQATGKVGVCMATSGPGATNLVTPIADAYMDSVPMVAITGQVGAGVHRHGRLPGGRHLRHHAADHQAQLPRAIGSRQSRGRSPRRSTSPGTGRPGPVLVDLPKDVLQERAPFVWPPKIDLPGYRPVTRPHGKQIREAAQLIAAAKRPVLYVGGGVLKARASAELRRLAELTGIPVVTTLMARGAFPDSHRQHLGMPGMHGSVAAVTALQKADLLIALGTRFDDRVTGRLDTFAPHARGHPRRHRPGRDRQEPRRRRADRRRRPRGARRARSRRRRPSSPRRPGRPHRLVAPARPVARDLPARLRRAGRRHARAAVRHRAARRDRRPGDDLRRRRRPAPDVGGAVHRVREARTPG